MTAVNHETNLHKKMRPGFFSTVRNSLKYLGLTKAASLFLMLKAEEKKFLNSAATAEQKKIRTHILSKIRHIYNSITCLHFPFHYVQVAKFILDLDVEGPIIECGSYLGGSSAQLSVIAKQTNRKLYVCDSFEGLPAPKQDEASVQIFNDQRTHTYKQGDYAAALDLVKSNIEHLGHIEVCEFVKGFFSDSLPGLSIHPAVIMLDVDLISSARDCLKILWPQLKPGGYVFTHEAESETYMKGLMDKTWWKENLGECPPLVFGAGSSLSPVAEGLAMFRKE